LPVEINNNLVALRLGTLNNNIDLLILESKCSSSCVMIFFIYSKVFLGSFNLGKELVVQIKQSVDNFSMLVVELGLI
jgi:hypothetical protein